MPERRQFLRIIYQVPVTLYQDTLSVTGHIQDLSLHGLLLNAEHAERLQLDHPVDVSFTLAGSDVTIYLVAKLISNKPQAVRLSIEYVDIESITHLKRLIALNVGNDELLQREIEQLSDLGGHQ